MHRSILITSLLLLLSAPLAGCVDGPFKLGKYNPMYTKEWEKDKEFGPSLHDKLDELDALRLGVSRLTPQEQQQRSQELLGYLREEKNMILISRMVRTIAVFPTPESLEALRMASRHSDPDIRIVACQGWATKKTPEAIESLAKTLGEDTDPDVKIAAARALEKFRDPTAVQALGGALEANDPALQFRAVQSLKAITNKDFGDSIPAWRQYVQSGQAKPIESPSIAQRLRGLF